MAATRTNMLTMENIRCFSKGTLALRPLTILLGENSTGKTTTLACHQTSHDLLGKRNPDATNAPFNQFPHSMGDYQNIVRKRLSASGPTRKTKQRVVLTHELDQLTCQSTFFENKYGQIEIEKLLMTVPGDEHPTLELQLSENGAISKLEVESPAKLALSIPRKLLFAHDMKQYFKSLLLPHIKDLVVKGDSQPIEFVDKLIKKISNSLPDHRLIGIPARKPTLMREYEFLENDISDGDDMLPHQLRLLQINDNKTYQELVSRLNKIGQATKTFENFEIVNETNGQSHFRLMATRDGRRINICDMGTGIWPVITQFIAVELESIFKRAKYFHLQHFEEYSHPRLHAEMVKWLCEKTKQDNMLIVETHSDYVLMRLTIEICQEKIDPNNIAVAYFEHDEKRGKSLIHNLRYDEDGSIVEPPDSFQKFYFEETERYVLSSRKR